MIAHKASLLIMSSKEQELVFKPVLSATVDPIVQVTTLSAGELDRCDSAVYHINVIAAIQVHVLCVVCLCLVCYLNCLIVLCFSVKSEKVRIYSNSERDTKSANRHIY